MPGVPGYPAPGPDWSAEVHQPCLQCCSAAVLQCYRQCTAVAGLVSHQTQRHIIYITHADTATGGHT